jgi:hypothetical protein
MDDLHTAACSGNLQDFIRLVESGHDIDEPDDVCTTNKLLIICSMVGHHFIGPHFMDMNTLQNTLQKN